MTLSLYFSEIISPTKPASMELIKSIENKATIELDNIVSVPKEVTPSKNVGSSKRKSQ